MVKTLNRRQFGSLVASSVAGVTATSSLIAPAWAAGRPRYAMLVRVLGNTAFDLAHEGAKQAAKELGIDLIYTGPTENTAEGQVSLINALTDQKVDAIMLSANDRTALTPSLRRARSRGIKVVTWDQDTQPAARSLFVAEATNELIALGPAKIALKLTGGKGQVGIITGAANSTTQNIWVNDMIRLTKEDPAYKGLTVDEVAYGDERSDKAYNEALGLVNKYPDMRVIVCYTSVGLAAAAKMVTDQNLIGKVQITGLGFPNEMVDYVLSGAVPAFAIWNMVDEGYATTYATNALVTGQITGAKGGQFNAGHLGKRTVGANGTVVLGQLTVYNKTNVEAAAKLIKSLQKK